MRNLNDGSTPGRPYRTNYVQLAGDADVVLHVLRAASIFGDEVYEHNLHKLKSLERTAQLWIISINLRSRAL